jgi:hypothetical protein
MKTTKFFKTVLGLSLLLVMISGCKKDEFTTTGTLKVTYANIPSDLTMEITPAENSKIAISDWLKLDYNATLIYDLNIGNYILISSSTTYFPIVGFQIKAGQTTEINFDANNEGHVK